MTDDGSVNRGAKFLHREIFHLKPRKDDLFRAHLCQEYSSSVQSRSRTRTRTRTQPPVPEGLNRRNGGGGRNTTNANRSIIERVRRMNGCYSFDIYIRAENPFKEEEKAVLKLQNETRGVNNQDVSAEKNPTEHNESNKDLGDRFVATKEKTRKRKASGPMPETHGERDLPHQFMAMGRWENSYAYEMFYVNRAVQKFFCPLVCRKISESLPILTMWRKENGVHSPMHNNNNNNRIDEASEAQFAMTRKRILKDVSSLEEALTLAKKVALLALKEDGCIAYDICTTGHPDFNQNEIMEVGVWKSQIHFISSVYNRQSVWAECSTSLFDNSSEETAYWERPHPSASSD